MEQGSPPCCIIATASPCKFEVSVTTAVGADKWREYADGPKYPKEASGGGALTSSFERAEGGGDKETGLLWATLTKQLLMEGV